MDSNYLLGYVCDPVAELLAIDVLADHSGTVGGDADGVGQGRARGYLGPELVQHALELLHVGRGGGSPGKRFDPVTELIAAPAHYPSIVGDAIREALIRGYVRECAQFDQPPLVGIKERNPVSARTRGLSHDLRTIAVHSRSLADRLGTEKQFVFSAHPTYWAARAGGILPKADDRLPVGRDCAGSAAVIVDWMPEREVAGLRRPLKAFRVCASPGEPHGYRAIAAYSVATAPAIADPCAAVVRMAQINQAARVP